MRLRGSAEVVEARRVLALGLLDRGMSLNEVARAIGSAPSSVMRWRNARERGGVEALKVRRASGRPPRLNAQQREKLKRVLLEGPMSHGFRTDVWTTARIATVIERRFRVAYHPDHVGRLLHKLGWTAQKPERRALERKEEEIERWKQETWSEVKKTPSGWVPTSSS